jgi:hypothetical protein
VRRATACVVFVALAIPRLASAEAATTNTTTAADYSSQIWANAIFDWRVARPVLLELDVEPRLQVRGGSEWWTLAATPLAEFYPSEWVDLSFETPLGYALQRPSVGSVEMSQRAGARLYPLQLVGVSLPKSRLTVSDLVRVERRAFQYFGTEGETSSNDLRFRNRVELRVGFDAAGSTEPQPLYLIADLEAFVPAGPRATERFATKARVRFGVGYRASRSTAFEFLFVRDWTRSTLSDTFAKETQAIDLRVKTFF